MRQRAKLCADRSRRCVANIWLFFNFFQDGGRPPSWICYTPVWTNHEVYFSGLYLPAKFRFKQCSSFDKMQVLMF